MKDAEIVDSHVHFWDPKNLTYAWHESVPTLARSFTPGDFCAAAAASAVIKMVFVECGCARTQAHTEVAWVTELARREPRLQGIVAQAHLERGTHSLSDLTALALWPLVKGVRRNFENESDPHFCLRAEFIAGVRLLARFDFSCDLCVRHTQLPAVIDLVRQCSDVRFVVDHCGKPDIRNQVYDPWRQNIETLAKLPNVSCKISGLLTEGDRRGWTAQDFRPYIRHVMDSFGPHRIMFGGDWPVLTLGGTYAEWLDVLHHCLEGLSAPDLARFYRSNAETFYRLPT
jgi:L-fuconolactonase